MTREEKRSLASLRTVPGYWLLLQTVVKSNRDTILSKLMTTHGSEDIIESALELRAWEKVLAELERVPRDCEEELRKEGDSIYG